MQFCEQPLRSANMPLTTDEELAIRDNLFLEAASAILTQKDFPWHRDRTGDVTAKLIQSSQALAIDVFGTLQSLEGPTQVIDALLAQWGLISKGAQKLYLEYTVPKITLCEPRSTQIDAVIESDTSIIFIECKFTEADGGSCSQVNPLGGKSPNRGKVQCTGNYASQVNPVNRKRSPCALTGKGVRYWELVPSVLSIANEVDHLPCPFKDGWYQWMRNLVACRSIAESTGKQGAFVILYADGPFSMAKKIRSLDWQKFQALTAGKAVPLITMSYQELLALATATAVPADVSVMKRLSAWVDRKVTKVAHCA